MVSPCQYFAFRTGRPPTKPSRPVYLSSAIIIPASLIALVLAWRKPRNFRPLFHWYPVWVCMTCGLWRTQTAQQYQLNWRGVALVPHPQAQIWWIMRPGLHRNFGKVGSQVDVIFFYTRLDNLIMYYLNTTNLGNKYTLVGSPLNSPELLGWSQDLCRVCERRFENIRNIKDRCKCFSRFNIHIYRVGRLILNKLRWTVSASGQD